MTHLVNMSVCLRETKMAGVARGYSSNPGNFLSMKRLKIHDNLSTGEAEADGSP